MRNIIAGRSWERKRFRDLVLQGVREMLEKEDSSISQVVIAIVHNFSDQRLSVREELIPLASRLYHSGCFGCNKRIVDPHPTELFRCRACGDLEVKYRELSAKIPKGHALEIELKNALWGWKCGGSSSRVRSPEVAKALKKLAAWPWNRALHVVDTLADRNASPVVEAKEGT